MDEQGVNALLERPIVVIGAPRSGTTVLAAMLAAHPGLALIVEPRLTWRYGNDRKCDRLAPADARPAVVDHIRRALAAEVAASHRHRLLEKTPSNTLRMGFVERVLPGCLFVHVVRDGVESSLSIRDSWQRHAHGVPAARLWRRLRELDPVRAPHYALEFLRRIAPGRMAGLVGAAQWGVRIPGLDGMLREMDLLEVSCAQWRMCVEDACHFGRSLPRDRYLEVGFDSFDRDGLDRLLEFCGLGRSAEVRASFESSFDRAYVTHWRERATARELATLERWTGPTREWLESHPMT